MALLICIGIPGIKEAYEVIVSYCREAGISTIKNFAKKFNSMQDFNSLLEYCEKHNYINSGTVIRKSIRSICWASSNFWRNMEGSEKVFILSF